MSKTQGGTRERSAIVYPTDADVIARLRRLDAELDGWTTDTGRHRPVNEHDAAHMVARAAGGW